MSSGSLHRQKVDCLRGKESTQNREGSRGVSTRHRDPCTPGKNSSVLARAACGDTKAELRGDQARHRPQIGRGSHVMSITYHVGPFCLPPY